MRIPLSWLAEYVELPEEATMESVAADLVRVGLEEEGASGGDITGPLVVGKVLTKEPEPQKNGKVINWCSLDVGRGENDPQHIVCGAQNFEVGDFVVTALPGAVLPGDFAISPRKTYGHISEGMICSTEELGLGPDPTHGIIVLAEHGYADVTPGQDCLELLGLVGRESEVIEINVTPDRGYCFSVRGVAREYAHGSGRSIADVYKDPAQRSLDRPASPGVPVHLLEDATPHKGAGCPRFVARAVRGIDPSATTPSWMKRRLTLAGMRPISLVVDVTNYVMLGLGQPLHAYDLSRLAVDHGITVRRATSGETLKTLDGQERTLHPEDLVISDGESGARVLGIAGVMGGASTEVDEGTTDVLIESAYFDPITVARSARRHKLPSEASKRFERGVDPQLQAAAAQLAVELLTEVGGGSADSAFTDEGVPLPGVAFDIDARRPGQIVGVDYEKDRVVEILREIGCGVEDRGETLTIQVPSWRPDLSSAEDLTEEIARIDGYEMIPTILPTAPASSGLPLGERLRRRVSDYLAAKGLNEVLTYPFTSETRFTELGYADDDPRRCAVRLANPVSEEQPLMRTDILQTLVDAVTRNVGRHAENVALFEVGQVTAPSAAPLRSDIAPVDRRPTAEELAKVDAGVPDQPVHVAAIITGERERSGWQGQGRAADWSDAVSIVRGMVTLVGLRADVRQITASTWHPGRCAEVSIEGQVFGFAGELHPTVVEKLSLPDRAVAFEVDLDVLINAAGLRKKASPLANFAVTKEDVALIVDESVSAADLEDALRAGGGELLEDVRLFDVYSGEQTGEGKKSMAFSLRMRASNRTLNAEEAAQVRGAAVAVAQKRFDAVLRDG